MKKYAVILLLITINTLFCCTIGVINGSATADGRPVIWKSREAGINVQMMYEDNYFYQYIGSGNSGSEYIWMGMNETGLAIANAIAGDLDRLPGNGDCMLQALRNYATIDEFIAFLDSTNVTGRETQTNYVMMDATGAAVVLEVGTTEYWVYNTADTEYGFLVRDNFSFAGGGTTSTKYELMNAVLEDLAQAGPIEWQDIFPQIIRDFYDENHNPLPVPFEDRWDVNYPYGYLPATYSNSGLSNSSVALMHGVTPGEPAWYSIMWTILGTPTCGIALPYWSVCPMIPQPAAGSPTVPLTSLATQIRQLIYNSTPATWADSWLLKNDQGTGFWDLILDMEQETFSQINNLRQEWLQNPPAINDLQILENTICNNSFQTVQNWQPEMDYTPYFSCYPIEGEAPLTVQFIDNTHHDPDSIAWDFYADGVIDTLITDNIGEGANWIYQLPGSYSVRSYAWHGEQMDSLFIENAITVHYPAIEYLAASTDTVICLFEEPYYQAFYLYNISDYPVELQEFYFAPLAGYENPHGTLFFWYFADENPEFPFTLAAGDSCQIIIHPVMPTREFWGETLIIAADLDTLQIPCLYDENLWNDKDHNLIEQPAQFLENYPNPFNPSTKISFYLNQPGNIDLFIYNLKGQLVKSLPQGYLAKGNHSLSWQGDNNQGDPCSSGIYLIALSANGKTQLSRTCLLLK
jgi:hypothetical protein